MFNIDETPQFWTSVEVQTPVDDGFRTDTFRARFKVVDDDELEALEPDQTLNFKDQLRIMITDLDEIVDEKGASIPFSTELLDRVLSKQHVRIALFKAYSAAITKERAGN